MISIGFDAKRAFSNTSGLGNYSRFVIEALVRQFPEHRYLLFAPKSADLSRFPSFASAIDGLAIKNPGGILKALPALWRTFGIPADLKRFKIDLYHGLSNELPFGISKSGVKSVVTIHDLIFLRYPELYQPIDRAIYEYKFKSACQQADKVVAISEQTRQDLVDFFGIAPEKINVIYQDCSPLFHHPQTPEILDQIRKKYALPAQFVLTVGTMEERKNQLPLLRAWHQSGLWEAADLVLAGKQTTYTLRLKQYAAQHKLESKMHFLPYIPEKELPAIYQLATLFAYPSTFEGFGIPILESLNSGVPVITSTGSCFAEAGGEAALYVPPQNEQALGKALLQVWENAPLRASMVEKGKAHTRLFRSEKTTPQLMKLYEGLLG